MMLHLPSYTTRCFIRPHAVKVSYPSSLIFSRLASRMASSTGNGGGGNNNNNNPNNKPPLEKRAVVSSFLYKFVQENGQTKPKVALFKRSGQVRTYQ